MAKEFVGSIGSEMGAVHARSALVHEETAARHEATAVAWDARGKADWGEFERRCAAMERAFARLAVDRSDLEQLRARSLAQWEGGRSAEIEHRGSEIRLRTARLRAEDAELKQQRARLRGARHAGCGRPDPTRSTRVDDDRQRVAGERDAARTPRHTRQDAQYVSSVLTRTAQALEESARLAEMHAAIQEQAGRGDAANYERRIADFASKAAQRARDQAGDWFERATARAP